MNLNEPTKENLDFVIDDMAGRLKVVNRAIMDPNDYDMENYQELLNLHSMLVQKGNLSPSETEAFLDELATYRKN